MRRQDGGGISRARDARGAEDVRAKASWRDSAAPQLKLEARVQFYERLRKG